MTFKYDLWWPRKLKECSLHCSYIALVAGIINISELKATLLATLKLEISTFWESEPTLTCRYWRMKARLCEMELKGHRTYHYRQLQQSSLPVLNIPGSQAGWNVLENSINWKIQSLKNEGWLKLSNHAQKFLSSEPSWYPESILQCWSKTLVSRLLAMFMTDKRGSSLWFSLYVIVNHFIYMFKNYSIK